MARRRSGPRRRRAAELGLRDTDHGEEEERPQEEEGCRTGPERHRPWRGGRGKRPRSKTLPTISCSPVGRGDSTPSPGSGFSGAKLSPRSLGILFTPWLANFFYSFFAKGEK